jgi:hypothetical protein
MSFYLTTPFKPSPKLMVQGTPEYMFGSLNSDTGPTQGNVISNSATGTTATLVVQILSGNVPTTYGQITVVGTANSAGIFNVTNAQILSVTQVNTPDTGLYSITYAISATSQASTSDAGQFIVPVPEVGDQLTASLITSGVASAPVVSPVASPNSTGKSLSATIKLPASTTANPSTLAALPVYLQGANIDFDSEYNDIAQIVATGSAGNTYEWQSGQGDSATGTLVAGSVNQPNFRFYRFRVGTGGSGTGPIIGKLLQ